MKKIILGLFALILCTSFGFKNVITDYRDSYVGRYFCNSNCQKLTADGASNSADTTSIYVSKDATDSILQISIKGSIVKVKLIQDTMLSYPVYGKAGGNFFSTDSIKFGVVYGRSYTCNLKGRKR